ncbi:helix-hairpin-helix domain-containing protein [Fodinibius sp.]|uniref:helix-hairpin-helix domain-containing protein n=1 Tax=Fodinibius sp. TaxID=1872440 RepID=UPI002ACEEFF2|nr:helix-hairpin-helix domain-containing protein [Fodinibius sp.]MDZ7658704.1 helix-hairpin-helix domain-containing protein [Fodinibius sp.]
MRFFWKIVLIAAIPLGGYWLYKNCSRPTEVEVQSDPKEESMTTAEERGGVGSTDQIIEKLSNIDGVTSRVAENLVEMGIKSKEALLKLSEEELRSVKGIGPKRAEKILNLE